MIEGSRLELELLHISGTVGRDALDLCDQSVRDLLIPLDTDDIIRFRDTWLKHTTRGTPIERSGGATQATSLLRILDEQRIAFVGDDVGLFLSLGRGVDHHIISSLHLHNRLSGRRREIRHRRIRRGRRCRLWTWCLLATAGQEE